MDTIELIKKFQAGDPDAREQIVINNMALVWSIVRRFSNRGYEPEDLFQIGCIGLMKAVDKFDVKYEVKFSTYAVPMIIGEIKRFLRDDGLVKVSRSLKENSWKIKQAADRLLQEKNCEPTLMDISEYTGLSCEDIAAALGAVQEVESIYSTVYSGNGDDIYMVDRLADTCQNTEFTSGYDQDCEKEHLINQMFLDQLIKELPENEQKLIDMRYYQEKTQTEVAEVLGISQVQVSRLEKRVLLKLRKKAAC